MSPIYKDIIPNNDNNLVYVGKITSLHGIKGFVKIASFTDPVEQICSYRLLDRNSSIFPAITIKARKKDLLICKIAGIDDTISATKLIGTGLYIEPHILEQSNDPYIKDLIGMDVIEDGSKVGIVLSIANFGASDIVEIAFTDGQNEMFEFSDANFPEINIPQKYIRFNRPKIL